MTDINVGLMSGRIYTCKNLIYL